MAPTGLSGDLVRLALLARATDRGLGIQTRSLHDHLYPERTLVLDMGRDRDPLDMHLDWYPDAWDVCSPEQLTDDELEGFLGGMDVLLSAETFYREDLPEVARRLGVRTVLQGNFEFLPYLRRPELPKPDLFLAPSPWHLDEWPEPTRLLPFPVDRSRFPFRRRTEAMSFLHVGGWAAMADRNGTWLFLQALRHVHVPMRVVVTSQVAPPSSLTDRRSIPACVDLDLRVGDVEDNRSLYSEGDVLVQPRRFGGQSLVLNEGASCGMAAVTLDRHPENAWVAPPGLVTCRIGHSFEAQSRRLGIADASPEDLAARLMVLAGAPEAVAAMSDRSDAYADSISWDRLKPEYEAVLAGDP